MYSDPDPVIIVKGIKPKNTGRGRGILIFLPSLLIFTLIISKKVNFVNINSYINKTAGADIM
jgi:hypothetical protein